VTADIVYRIFYPVKECAQLRGCSEQHIYRLIRNGRRSKPTGEYIDPSLVEHNGANLVIHRSFIFPSEPGPNVAPMTPQSDLTDEQIDRVIGRWLARLGMLAESRRVA
jgi:hypothetical protein